jgi:hypothetical protein
LAHIGERLGIDDVIIVTGAQKREEVGAVLRGRRAEPCEVRVADLGTEAVLGFVRAPVSSTVIQLALERPARSTSLASLRKRFWRSFSRRTTCRLEMKMPNARNISTSRGTVTWP